MNKVMLIGKLIRDVEMYHTANINNTAIARYTLAVKRPFRQKGDPDADFLRCICFGRTAEAAERYLGKGMKVAIEGRIQTRNYTNDEGQKIYTTDIVVERQEFLERRSSDSQPAPGPDAAGDPTDGSMDIPDGIDEKLPFN